MRVPEPSLRPVAKSKRHPHQEWHRCFHLDRGRIAVEQGKRLVTPLENGLELLRVMLVIGEPSLVNMVNTTTPTAALPGRNEAVEKGVESLLTSEKAISAAEVSVDFAKPTVVVKVSPPPEAAAVTRFSVSTL